MGIEGPQGVEVPEPLKEYEILWNKIYGNDVNKFLPQLEALAGQLKESDPIFAGILLEKEGENANDDRDTARAWTLIQALSTYGLKFGLNVD